MTIAKELLGKVIVTNFNGVQTAGMITETEAYEGATDKACHAYGNRRTKRTETMFYNGGVAYVFLCYGIHHLFNVVTNISDVPHAVLIRAIEPLEGLEQMKKRRKNKKVGATFSNGPGTASQALGITVKHDKLDLTMSQIWIEDRGIGFSDAEILITKRIGIDYAEEDAELLYRFVKKS